MELTGTMRVCQSCARSKGLSCAVAPRTTNRDEARLEHVLVNMIGSKSVATREGKGCAIVWLDDVHDPPGNVFASKLESPRAVERFLATSRLRGEVKVPRSDNGSKIMAGSGLRSDRYWIERDYILPGMGELIAASNEP